MTTIAFKNGTMAADSLVSGEWADSRPMQKVYRYGDMLVGVAGELSWITGFLSWLTTNDELEEYPIGVGYALVYRDKELILFEGDSPNAFPVGHPYAIGSGASFAMGAMKAGKGARAAVGIAIELDTASGGKIQYRSTKK